MRKIVKKIIPLRTMWSIFVLVLLSTTNTAFSQGLPAVDYLPDGVTYDPSVPTPESVLGANVGDWHVRHDQLVQYMYRLAAASDRVSITETGRTHENRPLLLLTITHPNNQPKLADIQKARLAQVNQGVSAGNEAPLIFYMGYSVHGNEPSGSNASLVVAYYLAAAQGEDVDNLLKNNVVLLDPSFNPDGLSRFAQWANMHRGQTRVADPEHREHQEGWPNGRTNHYWFDLNRDWLMLVHPESRARVQQFQNWRPHILTDYHEMGSNSTFFFQPGVPSRKYPLTPDENVTLTNALAKYHVAAFDKTNNLYFTQEGFDDFYYGKGSSYPDAQGSIGILFEQASSRGHVQDTINGKLTFADTIKNQVTMSLSTFAGAMANKPAILEYQDSFFDATESLIKRDSEGAYIVQETHDRARLQAFLSMLNQHNIRYAFVSEDSEINDKDYVAGSSVVVPLDQPQYRLIKSIFSTQKRFADNTFYDVSNWNLALAFNLEYDAISKRELRGIDTNEDGISPQPDLLPEVTNDAYAYAFDWHHYYAPALLESLLTQGVKARIANGEFTATLTTGTRAFSAGSIVIPAGLPQPDSLSQIISKASDQFAIPVFSLTSGFTQNGLDIGSRDMVPAELPKVLLVGGEGTSQYEVGEIWHYLDTRLGIPVTLVEQQRLASITLADYTHILLASGNYKHLSAALSGDIERWVKAGGTLYGQKSALRYFDKQGWLPLNIVSKEELNGLFDESSLAYGDQKALQAKKLIAGAAYQAKIDISHPLFFGFRDDYLPLFKTNNMIVRTDNSPFSTIARYTSEPLLAGYSATELSNRIAGSTATIVKPIGSGRVIGMTDNIHFRGYWFGTNKIMGNTLFMAPLMR